MEKGNHPDFTGMTSGLLSIMGTIKMVYPLLTNSANYRHRRAHTIKSGQDTKIPKINKITHNVASVDIFIVLLISSYS